MGANKYAGIFGSVYGGGFPLDKGLPGSEGKSRLPVGSMLFQNEPSPTHSPGAPSPSPWGSAAEQQHRHHFATSGAVDGVEVEDQRPGSATPPSVTAAHLTPREGLAA